MSTFGYSADEVSQWTIPFNEDYLNDLQDYGNSKITRGSFGEVSLALFGSDKKKIVAVKRFHRAFTKSRSDKIEFKERLRSEVLREICALRYLGQHVESTTSSEGSSCPITPLLALFTTSSDELCMVFDYCPTDLWLSLSWRRLLPIGQRLLPLDVIRRVAHDLFTAVEFCHKHEVVHGDIKPGNMLVSASGFVQLCDFGIAKRFQPIKQDKEPTSDTRMQTRVKNNEGQCTLQYRAPEYLLGVLSIDSIDPATDIYAAGVVLAELVLGTMLFPGTNELDQLSRIFQSLGTPSPTNWPSGAKYLKKQLHSLQFSSSEPTEWNSLVPRATECLNNLTDFLSKTASLDPSVRLTSTDSLEHDFLNASSSSPLIPRVNVYKELVPTELDLPVCLNVEGSSKQEEDRLHRMRIRQVLALAEARRKGAQ